MIRPGPALGPYEILGQIGAGGMGEVYRAKDPASSASTVALMTPDGKWYAHGYSSAAMSDLYLIDGLK
jgi:serine/threonine protein kinase